MRSAVAASGVRAAVSAAGRLGVACAEPIVLADGANVVVYLSPSPVVAKVAASTPAVRPDVSAWLQRELDVASYLARAGVAAVAPSREVPATVCEQLRRLHLTVWYAIYAERLPECRQRATELLAAWRRSP
jgi:hypothetical protein